MYSFKKAEKAAVCKLQTAAFLCYNEENVEAKAEDSMTKKKFSVTTAGIIVLACLFYAVNGGIRCNYGLFRGAVSDNSGVDYASISLILAVAQLSFGVMQPVFGALALKKTNTFVLGCGGYGNCHR